MPFSESHCGRPDSSTRYEILADGADLKPVKTLAFCHTFIVVPCRFHHQHVFMHRRLFLDHRLQGQAAYFFLLGYRGE